MSLDPFTRNPTGDNCQPIQGLGLTESLFSVKNQTRESLNSQLLFLIHAKGLSNVILGFCTSFYKVWHIGLQTLNRWFNQLKLEKVNLNRWHCELRVHLSADAPATEAILFFLIILTMGTAILQVKKLMFCFEIRYKGIS